LKTPIVATSVGGVPEVITDGRTGILIPPKDVDALANAILNLANDNQERKTLAQQGFDMVKSEFTFEKQSEELTHIYRGVLNASGSSDD
jgi:glycosyltransferase involved in cell wall biosynthesis